MEDAIARGAVASPRPCSVSSQTRSVTVFAASRTTMVLGSLWDARVHRARTLARLDRQVAKGPLRWKSEPALRADAALPIFIQGERLQVRRLAHARKALTYAQWMD